ncbi:MAG TPA: chemotaxis protein CheB [Steroidobacteraceae bacterium]|nr:chemotaxis protein CheB [Steroidobacteraceae bacterium]
MSESELGDATAPTPAGDAKDISAPADFSSRATLPFPVVGIGASAGGIEALRRFFSKASATSGMAYVVILHLSPDHESLMAEILGRSAPMPVHQIEDGTRIEPNHAYVIRPGHTVTLEGDRLFLGVPLQQRGHRRPVDDFFRSLAKVQQEKAIAVVLSGMGTNGTAGAQAIKAAGGLCVAQNPEEAEFPSMARSLIHAGYADKVLDIEQIPAFLQRFVHHPYLQLDRIGGRQAAQELEFHRERLQEVLALVRIRTGHDFAPYKTPTVVRRIQRRMGVTGSKEIKSYLEFLKSHGAEAEALANDLMINVTGFFRDADAWEALRTAVIRPMVESRGTNEPIRAWVAACASGEEAYTLAMVISEEAARLHKKLEVKIFATDTADKALGFARAGIYPGGIEADFTPERLARFFDKDEHTYRIKKEIREQVVFAPQDVLRDPPFSRVDVVTCRNLLIYLEAGAQRRALTLMHFALLDGGYLFLGNAETLGQAEDLFEVVSKRWRIYRRTGPAQHRVVDLAALRVPAFRALPGVPEPVASPRPAATVALQLALLEATAPATALVDGNERLVYFQGSAEPYLTHPSGEISMSLLDSVRASLRPVVRTALRQAIAEKRAVRIEQALVGESGGLIRITAAPLRPTGAVSHYRVSFEPMTEQPVDVVTVHRPSSAVADEALEEEVRGLKRDLQTHVEAFEATNEELKASNEEVMSINEELRSTNEELETGKEELQSLNEELTTVNTQLQNKLFELEALTNDLDNLLSSTDIAVVFLDTQLNVRRFTPSINDLLTLIPADVGRPLAHLAQKFTDGDLIADAAQVLAKLVPRESEVLSHSRRWYLRRTLPYRTEDNRIAGVVITFIDITARKQAEQAILTVQERLQAAIEQMPAAVLMVEAPSGKLVLANRQAAALFNQPFPPPYLGQNWVATYSAFRGFHADGRPYEPAEWPLARALAAGEVVIDEEMGFVRPDGSPGTLSMSTSPTRNAAGALIAVVAAFWDITERKRAQAVLRESEERLRLLIASAHDYAIFMLDAQARITSWNSGAEQVTGYREEDILGQSIAVLFTAEDRAARIPEQEIERAADTGSALDERWHLRKDGSRFWASGVMTAARAADGNPKGFVKIMRDNTERKATEERLQEALAWAQQHRNAAESANRAKDEFISTVSHELRTPLNTIRVWSRLLMSGKIEGADIIKGGETIDRAALSQQQLIDDLLDVSRMATGHLRLAMRDTFLISMVEAAIETVRPLAHSRDISLEADLSPEVGIVHADPDRLQQVILNLLANAVKFSSTGGRIEVSLRRLNEQRVEIGVKDYGMGIRADFLPHVFDRFRQAEAGADRRYNGLGLGLAIAHQLVELHGGAISAHSAAEGQGATFIIDLPLQRRYPAIEPEAATREIKNGNDLRGLEVLLVEDDTLTREATQRLLEQCGAQVRAVNSASRAREAFEIRPPNLIVADIGMPGEDGNAFLKWLRQIEQEQGSSRVPAVAVTAFARAEDRERSLKAGFDDHLPKPVDPDRLIRVLAQLAAKAR